jgi:hypothetical protein
LSAGAGQTLSVSFTRTLPSIHVGDGDGRFTVVSATAHDTWTGSGCHRHGTPLEGTQLNATRFVPGTFVYTPAAGDNSELGCRAYVSRRSHPNVKAAIELQGLCCGGHDHRM